MIDSTVVKREFRIYPQVRMAERRGKLELEYFCSDEAEEGLHSNIRYETEDEMYPRLKAEAERVEAVAARGE